MGEGNARDAAGTEGETRRHMRAWLILGLLVAAAAVYYALFLFVAYTEDAYVWSDLVTVAPQVNGRVKTVEVWDNQAIAAGDLVATIDPQHYQLDVDFKTSRVANLQAAVAVKEEISVVDVATVDAARAALVYAQAEFDRIAALVTNQTVSQAELDRATDALRTAKDRLADRQAKADVSNRETEAARAAVGVAKADLALALYRLSQTRLTSPARGTVNNLSLRPGDYANVGEALVGIVDASQWRLIANFKEEIAAKLEPGHKVWVWLDSDPWHIRTGRVQGVGRGIARERTKEQLLPYVAPTTDWIRLQRRLPVTILFDPPLPPEMLFMGADARVFLVR